MKRFRMLWVIAIIVIALVMAGAIVMTRFDVVPTLFSEKWETRTDPQSGLAYSIPKEWNVEESIETVLVSSGREFRGTHTKITSPDYQSDDPEIEPEDLMFVHAADGISIVISQPEEFQNPEYRDNPQAYVTLLEESFGKCDGICVESGAVRVGDVPAYFDVTGTNEEPDKGRRARLEFVANKHLYKLEFYFGSYTPETKETIKKFIRSIQIGEIPTYVKPNSTRTISPEDMVGSSFDSLDLLETQP